MTQSSQHAARDAERQHSERRDAEHRNAERRHNPHLREMVDELLATIRVAANQDLWTTDERTQCEADMARIMDNIRQQALAGRRISDH